MRTLTILLAVALLAVPAYAKDAKAEKPQPHADEVVKPATKRFKQDYASDDMDKRLRILKWYGMHMHKEVLKTLKKIFLTEKNVELQAMAAEGLAGLTLALVWAGVTVFVWITLFCRVLPDELGAELREYQHEGFVWLARLAEWGAGACLADEMGLGKTVQALAIGLVSESGAMVRMFEGLAVPIPTFLP